ncbi:hypothetical protein VKT23_009146 [Stygiomarasmius scandens]|uniref:Uncharacterized protein n=1 Tax=Marasmiellus scandens TaxID=2682957 RepID=A0ABR1JHX5_9AGAR
MDSPRHDNPYLDFRVYAPSSRPLRSYHPYKRTLRIAYSQTKVGVSQEELNRFLAAVALLPPLHQHHQNLQHDHHLQQPQHPPHQADDTERENAIVQANAAEPELEFRRRRKLGDFLEFILTLIILAILIAASHFFSD